MKYKQLNLAEREKIYLLRNQGKTLAAVAIAIGRDKSTISRELRRNNHEHIDEYLPDTAQRKTDKRKTKNRKKCYLKKDLKLKRYIIKKLTLGWSPELIAGRIKSGTGKYYNHESIYQYIYSLAGRKENLRYFLRRSHRIRHKKDGRKHQKGKIPNRVDIIFRPKIVEKREQFGHWEGDSMLFRGHSQQLATHAERKTRFIMAIRANSKASAERAKIINRRFMKLPTGARRTMTLDNGLEFAAHETIAESTGLKIYFAKPYASWQRGTNENCNGLIRWYLPRKTDINSLTAKQLNKIINLINNRPKKCLNFKTPAEAFNLEMNKLNCKFKP